MIHFGPNSMPRLALLCARNLDSKLAYGMDWSAFDSTIPPKLIRIVFGLLERLIEWPSEEVKYKKYRNVFDYVKNYFIYTPLMFPDG